MSIFMLFEYKPCMTRGGGTGYHAVNAGGFLIDKAFATREAAKSALLDGFAKYTMPKAKERGVADASVELRDDNTIWATFSFTYQPTQTVQVGTLEELPLCG